MSIYSSAQYTRSRVGTHTTSNARISVLIPRSTDFGVLVVDYEIEIADAARQPDSRQDTRDACSNHNHFYRTDMIDLMSLVLECAGLDRNAIAVAIYKACSTSQIRTSFLSLWVINFASVCSRRCRTRLPINGHGGKSA